MTICVGLSDLTQEKQEEYVEAVEVETGEPFSNSEVSHEFWVEVRIDEEGTTFR